MIFRNLPALVTLTASLIACIITFIYRYNPTKALIFILGTAIVFFFAGTMIRSLLNHFLVTQTPEDGQEGEESEEEDTEESE